MKTRTIIASSVAAIYLMVGAWFGYALYASMPAVNLLGASYVAVSWPLWLKASPIRPPIPNWVFTFPARAR